MKIKYNIYFLLLLLYFVSACDSPDNNPDFFLEALFLDNDERLLNYNAVINIEREPFFIEEFDDNVSQFPHKIGSYINSEVNITDGKMIIKYFTNNGYVHTMSTPIEIDESRNFEMEISLMVYSIQQHTFMWLSNQVIGNEYAIVYAQLEDSNNKKIETIWLRNIINDWESLKGCNFNAKEFLKPNEFTLITIRKIENKYAIFINYKLFYIINDKNFNFIPTITMNESVINIFDYFRVYYLP